MKINRQGLNRATGVFIVTGGCLLVGSAVHASLSAEGVRQSVQNSDILPKEYRQQVYAACDGGLVTVSLFRHPDATRDDCKIDSVLLTRRVMQLDPAKVKQVRCVFYDYDRQNQFWQVEVSAALVRAFAGGKIRERELLDSLVLRQDRQSNPFGSKYAGLSYKGMIENASVVPGPLEERRLAVDLRLRSLKEQGVDVNGFRDNFLRIEDATRRGKTDKLAAQLEEINRGLDSQVDMLVTSGALPKPQLNRSSGNLGEGAF